MREKEQKLRNKNILIAGGTGLVGTNLTLSLKERGAHVLSTYFSKEPLVLRNYYKRFDFTEFGDCIEATKDMDYVLLCAVQSVGAKMIKSNPAVSLLANLKINAGLLEACRQNKVRKIVFISSSTIYQEANYPIPEVELDLNKPPYGFYFGVGWLNRYIEQLAMFYFKIYDMKIGIVRPTNIYGPYDKTDIEKSNVIPALIMRALKKEDPFIVWGDGRTVRDFIFVEDFVKDILRVLENYCICDPLNLGSGKATMIGEAAEVILKACNHIVIPQFDKTKPVAIPYRMLDIDKTEAFLGKSQRTPFKEGIKRTVLWYESRLNCNSGAKKCKKG